ncbi:MAG: cysteine desulfurase [Rhodospirillales bacterium]
MSATAPAEPRSDFQPRSGHNATLAFDVAQVRADFPILARRVYDKPLVYLDSAASAQKPRQVLDAMDHAARHCYANVHRGVHRLSQESTDLFEEARETTRRFLKAGSADEIVFTSGATEAINLVAQSYGRAFLKAGDEVILSTLEHHSNIVPWQILRDQIGIEIKVAPIGDDGGFLFEEFEKLVSPRTKIVAVAHVSNALGTVVPVKQVIDAAHAVGAVVLLDGCQAAPHQGLDVAALDVDFYAFSGHKVYGPTGIGVLYGKRDLLNAMPPYQGGGEMIQSVTFEKTTYKETPHRFEAGTPPILEAVGLNAAIAYMESLGQEAIAAHEAGILAYATERLSQVPGVRLIGTAPEKASIVSFVMDDVHAHDIGTIVDRMGVAVRVGHHCAEPLMHRLGVDSTARASFGLYNTREEVDALAVALMKVRELFA